MLGVVVWDFEGGWEVFNQTFSLALAAEELTDFSFSLKGTL